jgi:hypothetical protein
VKFDKVPDRVCEGAVAGVARRSFFSLERRFKIEFFRFKEFH